MCRCLASHTDEYALSATLLPSFATGIRSRVPSATVPTRGGRDVSDALVVVLVIAVLVAVGGLIVVVRRKPPAAAGPVDEQVLRRLLDEAVSRGVADAKPAEPDLGRFALLSHEAQAAAEAADAVRRTAAACAS